ncbi:universal stress protein [Ottowia pentelensis]|uniref:universal stress protein n=1 Tax=Ottowia pentelensis TaxID=511108 RepID=UPI00363DE2FC
MYERILVTLDGSSYSEEIMAYAAGLAAAAGSALTLLRVVDKAADAPEAEAYLQRLAAAHGAQGECVVAPGDVATAILAHARQAPGTLVAITSHGRSGLLLPMLGSVALNVVRASGGEPVLVYRPTGQAQVGAAALKVRSVVLPLDGTELSEAMIPQAGELAKRIGAELEIVGVVDPRQFSGSDMPHSDDMKGLESGYVRNQARTLSERYQVPADWEVLHGEPAEAITGYISGRRDVILAMATHGRTALKTALLGSVTAGCLRAAGVPVLMRAP